ncbi:MAG: hypothetical protein RR441_05840 [Longicatena sp.]
MKKVSEVLKTRQGKIGCSVLVAMLIGLGAFAIKGEIPVIANDNKEKQESKNENTQKDSVKDTLLATSSQNGTKDKEDKDKKEEKKESDKTTIKDDKPSVGKTEENKKPSSKPKPQPVPTPKPTPQPVPTPEPVPTPQPTPTPVPPKEEVIPGKVYVTIPEGALDGGLFATIEEGYAWADSVIGNPNSGYGLGDVPTGVQIETGQWRFYIQKG